jgi:hypothetical protein
MKNLKGCLKFSSKKRFHKRGHLLELIARLNTHIRSDLIVIDGTYAMDRGPVMGTAHPMDVIIAGRDVLETEMVGAAVLGKDPANIAHIQTYGNLTGRKVDLDSVEIKGKPITAVAMDLPWEGEPDQSFHRFGLSGIRVAAEPGDTTICSGCLGNLLFANFIFSKDNPGIKVDQLEICIGKHSKTTSEAKQVLLFGDCAIRKSREDRRAIKISGCPPDVGKYYPLLVRNALPPLRGLGQMLNRLIKNKALKLGLYTEDFGFWDAYRSDRFDKSLYDVEHGK